AMSLRAIVSQRLLPGVNKTEKRHLALEVMWNTHPIASAIRTNKIESIDNYIQTGREEGMFTFDESVKQLLRAGKITRATAEQNVRDVTYLKNYRRPAVRPLLRTAGVCYHADMSHAAFLDTIRSVPDDDTARLVYADFLEENGSPADAARAEFVRVQI